ncbi:diaminopropionate ammonia-lyase [Kribbella aluminosa]|uniref:Diaminopropionate ammonia-lyase n=1 Tax=Kribbella aluminosa TaxID=416017 RepID=A0ABS4UW67_9ACTN|nr:pyridoxal-phosphate dependent enzyme [Kribbella aluminosa]MBP2355796.1 diaminopropionate ammonia-lyase [Kribbella aluminosa]
MPNTVDFHRSMPGYAPTPLIEVPELLGVGSVWVKDESNRFGLPAFKVLGASWAVNQALGPARTFAELAADIKDVTLVTATDGNHGRALAYLARTLGVAARIYVPAGLPEPTVQAIRDEGATVIDTGRPYDDAVQLAAGTVDGDDVLIQDTAWPGYEAVPRWIVAGYDTLFSEIDEQHPGIPELVVVPTGVGSLLQSALEHYRGRAKVLAVEPTTAACVGASLKAGRPVSVDTSAPTIMAGLNCGTVSSIAWPTIRDHLDAAVTVTDDQAHAAMKVLHAHNIPAGPCGAAALAGARAAALPASSVVLISTEGR